MIFNDPNKYARAARLELYENSAIFHGYQEYVLTQNNISILPEDHYLQRKREILHPYFNPRYLGQRTVLDLGANSGFFCFWSLQNGAKRAVALDIDNKYINMMDDAARGLQINGLNTVVANLMEWNQPADIVFAFALTHWVYSCTATFGSLESLVKKLSQLCLYVLIIEWVSPEDPAIEFFHHLDFNKELIQDPYTLEKFELALSHHFQKYECIGDVTATRKLYIGFRTSHEIDLTCPLPIIFPEDTIIYNRFLTKHNGVDYWSRVYETKSRIYKQTSFDLAERESYFLSQLNGDYFPKEYGVQRGNNYTAVTLEKINGRPLPEVSNEITSSPQKFQVFVNHCLKILKILKQRGIMHRDIRHDNILIRNDSPVLIDFGWAISEKKPFVTPPGLGSSERPPDGSFCDIYSMGMVFKLMNQNKYSAFNNVINLMTEPDPSLRVKNLKTLEFLFALVAEYTEGLGDNYEAKK